MIKIILVLLLYVFILDARQNPFFPTEGEKDIPITNNKQIKFDPLKQISISLPTDARLIKKVVVVYKKLDGSIEKKSIETTKSIDWHLPIFISQSYTGDDLNKIISSEREQEFKVKKIAQEKKIYKYIYGTIYSNDKTIKLLTNDKITRNFMLVQPHRIVLDFLKETNIKAKIGTIKDSIVKKVRIGNHGSFYRVVLELDGFYQYELEEIAGGYLFSLR